LDLLRSIIEPHPGGSKNGICVTDHRGVTDACITSGKLEIMVEGRLISAKALRSISGPDNEATKTQAAELKLTR
jgi:hypothetical protein